MLTGREKFSLPSVGITVGELITNSARGISGNFLNYVMRIGHGNAAGELEVELLAFDLGLRISIYVERGADDGFALMSTFGESDERDGINLLRRAGEHYDVLIPDLTEML